MMEKRIITDLTEMDLFAADVVNQLTAQAKATILLLNGDLGVGKTTFVQAVARYLGVTDMVTSPTFVIQKNYHTQHTVFSELVHIDAYRLESGAEVDVLRIAEQCNNPSVLLCIEWGSRIADVLPSTHMYTIDFAITSDEHRVVQITPPGSNNSKS